MTTDRKMEIASNILISVFSSTNMRGEERLEKAPEYLEKIYNKIDELSKKDAPTIKDVDVPVAQVF